MKISSYENKFIQRCSYSGKLKLLNLMFISVVPSRFMAKSCMLQLTILPDNLRRKKTKHAKSRKRIGNDNKLGTYKFIN